MAKAQVTGSVTPNPLDRAPEEMLAHEELLERKGDECPFPIVDWDYWEAVNPDVIAWVTIPGTKIDYAVLQAPTDDPAYYLNHDIYKNWNPFGCPYVDAGCEGLNSPNTVIFAHNMGDGSSMFSQLARFSDAGFARKHPIALLQSRDERLVLDVAAIGIINGHSASKKTQFADRDEFLEWCSECFESAEVRLAEEMQPGSIVTLVTCSYNYFSNERTLVYSIPRTERNNQWQNDSDGCLPMQAGLSASSSPPCLQQRLSRLQAPRKPLQQWATPRMP